MARPLLGRLRRRLFLSVYGFGHYYFLRHAIRRCRRAGASASRSSPSASAWRSVPGRPLPPGALAICLASRRWSGSARCGWRWCSTRSWPRSSPTSVRLADRRLHFARPGRPRSASSSAARSPSWPSSGRVANCLAPAAAHRADTRGEAGRRPHQAHRVAASTSTWDIVGKQRFSRIVQAINALEPDVVLLAGDVIDEDLSRSSPRTWAATLRDLKPRTASSASPQPRVHPAGGRRGRLPREARRADAARPGRGRSARPAQRTSIAGAVVLAGRDDVSGPRFGGPERKAPARGAARHGPGEALILLDHQPRTSARRSRARSTCRSPGIRTTGSSSRLLDHPGPSTS